MSDYFRVTTKEEVLELLASLPEFLDVAYPDDGEFRKTKFTEEDIEKIVARGFDLRNFEMIEVEEE